MTKLTGKNVITETLASGGSSATALSFLVAGHPAFAVMSGLWACKPVREGISRLISGSIDLPEAWLHNKKLMIEAGYAVHAYASGAILIKLKEKQRAMKFTPQADGFNLSLPGKELMSLIPDQNAVSIEAIAENYRKNEFIGEILVGTIETIDGQSRFVPKSS
ncbi:hypothetical protein [Acetobacter aceti]|uniref:Uncharacterized protein n=1 Tax=Acetobacter aceti TaxID=435 RepID=A0A6S6PDS8_ACEAC|nr:hypothetical protein [Acetobacter aceti]BCI65868.1 hypothetical protein AAJCM20276_04920 [Acetobacter aceti]